MAYTTEVAGVLAETLERFATLNRHELAGHAANLDFWLGEVSHCLQLMEQYHKRFEAQKAAQMKYAAEHETTLYDLDDPDFGLGDWCTDRSASAPKRIPDSDLKESRRALRNAAYHLLLRCYKEDFIDEARLRQAADSVGTGIDLRDLKR